MNVGVRMDDGLPTVFYTSEADLQNGMAALAEAYGWRVQTEVVVQNWGRLDLVLHARDTDDYSLVVEFKLDLTKPSALRKAFQQADGYSRWLAMQGHATHVWLAPAQCDWAAAADLQIAYSESVLLVPCGQVLARIRGDYHWDLRAARARQHATLAARRARVANFALAELTEHQHRARLSERRVARRAVAEVSS